MRSPVELSRLAERYARYVSEPRSMPYLAWLRLGQIIRAQPPTQAFDLACHVIRMLPGSYIPSFGSGTLAHLIHHHGETLIDWIELEAWHDVDFLDALSSAWIARENLDPAVLARLRIATGTTIQIVTRPERDARYRAMFEQWKTRRPRRPGLARKWSPRVRPSEIQSVTEVSPLPDRQAASPPTPTEAAEPASRPETSSWRLRWAVAFAAFQFSLLTRPPVVQYMVHGAMLAWLPWFAATTIAGRLLLPTLIVVLGFTSTSPVSDLALVVGAFVLATVGGALGGLASGVIKQRRGQFTNAPLHLALIALVPFLTLVALIARTDDGLIVAPGVLAGLVSLSFIARFFQGAKLRRYRTRAPRQANAR